MAQHNCHARDCTTLVSPRLLMCRRHWRMVPQALQDEVWRTYRQGQELDKDPSMAYIQAAKAAIAAVAHQESPDGNLP